MEASPNPATQPTSAGYQRAERPPMGVLTQGILADRRLLGPLLRPAQRLLGRPRPARVRRTLPPFPGMLSEPPDADPHVRWCGGRRGEPGAYPSFPERLPRARRPVGGPSSVSFPCGRSCEMAFVPCLVRSMDGSELVSIALGRPLVDGYLEFVGVRGAQNTWLAVAYDLKVFFEVVGKEPAEVTAADVFAFLAAQRAPRRGERVVRIEDGEPGLAARTIARRLSSVAGLFEYLLARGDAGVVSNPVFHGLAGRRAGRRGRGGVRLVRTPRTLPRVLSPTEVDRLLVRTRRDRAMVLAMLLGGLRRCEVLGLRFGDVSVGERRVHIASGKGGRERIVPISGRFFAALGEYLELERPAEAIAEACFVVLKGPRRGLPLSPSGLDEVLDGARARAGLSRCTCHQLRHTCLTRLREQGMALEAVQAQAGDASIESTRIYLHLANDWLAREYLAAAEAIDAQLDPLAGELAS